MIFRRKHNTTNEFNKNVELTRRLIQSNNELLNELNREYYNNKR